MAVFSAMHLRHPLSAGGLPLASLLALAATLAAARGAGAQEDIGGAARAMAAADARRPVPMPIEALAGPIRLDGVVDEAAWEAVAPLPLTQHAPTFFGPLSEATEIRVAHDDRYLYVAGRMWDSRPDEIRTNTLYRDLYSGDDLMAVVIDSYNDLETAVWFVTNPAGARNDRTMANDAVFSGGMPMNSDWNAHWDVATSQTDEGWFAEMRIPFSTLGFQAVEGEVVMGLIAYRFLARENERQTFPAIDPRWGGFAFAKPSQAQRVVLRGVRQSKPFYITPYALAGVRQTPERGAGTGGGPAWSTASDPTTEAGLDLRHSPTSNLSLDLTLNTDFAQVEADDQQINLTRFPLFFPEKRQFFQERSSTFQFNTGGFADRLFHSRRIGLDGGEIVRIYGGARAVGRVGGLDFGVLDMQTASHDGRASENMGVLRLKQQVLNPYSAVGGMVTSRLGGSGGDNVAYGLDAVVRVLGDEWLTAKWAQTFDDRVVDASTLGSGLILARWERVRDEGLSYAGDFVRVGEDFAPGLGFQARRAYRYFGGRAQHKRFHGAGSPLRSSALQATTGHFLRTEDGTAESRTVEPELRLEFKGGTEVHLTESSSFESVRSPFTVAEATVTAGEYWFHEGRLRVQLPRSDLLRGDATATAGTFYDGTRVGLAVNPTWNQSKHLELGGGYEINRIVFAHRDEATTAHLVRFKAQMGLDTRVSLSAIAQFSDVADLTTLNARFRYNFREGTDLWVVFNEGLNTDRSLGAPPRLPQSAGRTILIKYTHTIIG